MQARLLQEEETQLRADCAAYLSTALVSGRRCLLTGTKYDLRTTFQLVALWFELSSDFEDVNRGIPHPCRRPTPPLVGVPLARSSASG